MTYLNFLTMALWALSGASADNYSKAKLSIQENEYTVAVKELKHSFGQEYDLINVSVTLFNKTPDTLKYFTWSNAPNYIFKVNSPLLKVKLDSASDLALPVLLKLSPFNSNSSMVVIKIKKEVKMPIRYRIGVQLIKDHDRNALNFGLYASNFDFTMVWSDEMTID